MSEYEERDSIHELWLIYCELKNLEDKDAAMREERLNAAREHLGRIINDLNHDSLS